MRRVWLFLLTTGLGGVGAVLGSMIGNAVGKTGLFIGAILGGVAAIALAVRLAAPLGLVSPTRIRHTTLGALGGFGVAAVIAVNTLSSPIGPLLSSALIGLGAIFGAERAG